MYRNKSELRPGYDAAIGDRCLDLVLALLLCATSVQPQRLHVPVQDEREVSVSTLLTRVRSSHPGVHRGAMRRASGGFPSRFAFNRVGMKKTPISSKSER
jgi:hypothetical protein